jgi:hypothetical protein
MRNSWVGSAAGDHEAEAGLFRRMARRIYLYGLRHLRDVAAAESHEIHFNCAVQFTTTLIGGDVAFSSFSITMNLWPSPVTSY